MSKPQTKKVVRAGQVPLDEGEEQVEVVEQNVQNQAPPQPPAAAPAQVIMPPEMGRLLVQ